MPEPGWLEKYYGSRFKDLRPEVYMEGKRFAVVKVSSSGMRQSPYDSVGYVLIQKDGKHCVTHYRSLHEGSLTQDDHDRMKKILEEADSG